MEAPTRKIRNLTINTDASFHPGEKVAGYAFYIVCDLFRITKGGMFKKEVRNSQEAEMMCIANAVSLLVSQKELPLCKLIIVNTDSLDSINRISGRVTPLAIMVSDLCLKLRALMGGYTQLEFRHVKAHNGTPDSRSWVNEWCDATAKKYMRQAVVEKQRKTNLKP